MKKSHGSGLIVMCSRGGGSVRPTPDRPCGGFLAQKNGAWPAVLNRRELAEVLDGECERTGRGFNATTQERCLFIPYDRTADPAVALVICKAQGLIMTKLAGMGDAAAGIAYATTLPVRNWEN